MTTFGEIVEPGSRTAWEDWDDIDNQIEQINQELKWKKNSNYPEVIETLLLLEGKYLAESLNFKALNLELINSIPEVHLNVYRSDGSNNYVCILNDYNLVMSSEIVELLKGYIKVSQNVITVQTKPFADYQATTTSTQDCIIRTVCTSSNKANYGYPKLEQPNIISGVSAGVISLREHFDSTGTAIICYLQQLEDVNGVHSLLKKLNIFRNVNTKPSSLLDSNLYI